MAKPSHVVMIKKKDGKFYHRVGAAWEDDRGFLSIKLDPCIVLSDRDDIFINIFPNKDRPPNQGSDGSDEIPF